MFCFTPADGLAGSTAKSLGTYMSSSGCLGLGLGVVPLEHPPSPPPATVRARAAAELAGAAAGVSPFGPAGTTACVASCAEGWEGRGPGWEGATGPLRAFTASLLPPLHSEDAHHAVFISMSFSSRCELEEMRSSCSVSKCPSGIPSADTLLGIMMTF